MFLEPKVRCRAATLGYGIQPLRGKYDGVAVQDDDHVLAVMGYTKGLTTVTESYIIPKPRSGDS